jgi:hypothetical protein|nr:MAG TPA: hypothetical protein [Crassvirales sp.]DAO83177.1 MAG TPA: hypothetical protein [Bacteriophage sp.]
MTTYSKKYFNEETQQWEPLYSTEGRSAYETAKLNGYTGTEEEFNKVLSKIPVIISSIESYPTEGSKNLITSGGVYQALKDSETSAEETHQELLNEISNVNSTLSTEISTVNTNLTTKITQIETTTIPNAIKAAIVDNLDTEDSNKALSATQGKVLKTMISNLANLRIEVVNELPSTGETNVIYLVKKTGTNPDVHDEYVYVEGNWEKIGNTEVDLSNYYTKDQVYTKSETYSQEEVGTLITEIEGKIPTIPNVETSMSGVGNVITSIDVDASNKHKIAAVKGISVYSKSEIDEKLSDSGLGDVIAEAPFTTADRVITSGGAGKTVKDSGILLTNLATKEFVNQFEPEWDKIANKPSTFTPSAHTHTVSQITDFPTLGALASKDKVDESDLNFNIPEGVVVDSALSTTSENPVQNKVITNALSSYVKTADLNVTLGNYYTTTEVYTKQEVNDKIASAGGGDVMASGNLEEDYIIVGAGTKSIKNSGQTLSNLALKSEIPSLENTWRPIKVGSITLNDSSTTLTIANGTGIGLSFSNGTLTITNSAPGSSYTLPVAKNNVLGGIKTGYTESGGAEMAIYTLEDGTAYTFLRDTAIKTALGYTPADVSDIPEIPLALPNPYALNITAGGSTTNYTGASESTINLDSIFSKPLASVDTPGKAGIFYGSSSSYSISTVYVTSSNPDAVIVVPTATTVTFGSNYVKMSGLDDLTGGSYKCYCITYINTGLVLVNGAIYG